MKILDTNVIIDDPEIVLDSKVTVPHCVLEELDGLKNKRSTATQARKASRLIVNNDVNVDKLNYIDKDKSVDDKLVEASTQDNMRVLTNDVLLVAKSRSYGKADVEWYGGGSDDFDELYSGVHEIELPQEYLDKLYQHNEVSYENTLGSNPALEHELYQNQFIDAGQAIARRYDDKLYGLNWNTEVEGIGELNRRQMMVADLLLDHRVRIVAMAGRAGTGKTSLAMNLATKQIQHNRYEKLVLSRPRVQAGGQEEEMGYLPGSAEEKTLPFLEPFFDNDSRKHSFEPEVLPLSMIQGRNIEQAIWVITEFQNVRKEDVDAIVERVGKGTKLIVEGDINQNNLGYNETDALTFLINSLKNEKLVGSVELKKVERGGTAKVPKLGSKLRDRM